jgi:GT2 family glycosyltransferase
MKTLSVIIVNYNTISLLEECLRNLEKIDIEKQVIVVDNGSTDGSAEMTEQNFPYVELIKTQNNGLAAGNNLGLDRAIGDYILFLGTDAFPGKEVITGIMEYMGSQDDVGVCTAELVLRDGTIDMDAHRGFPTPWAALTHFSKLNVVFPSSKIFNRYFLGYENMGQPHEIDLCIAHFMMVKKEVFENVGRWDEEFFVYGEDVDFCYRVKQAGWKIMYLPQFKVLHYKGSSVGIRKETKDITTVSSKSEETGKKMKSETTRAMRIFYRKHYTNKYPKLLTGFVLFGINTLEKLRSKGIGLG